MRLNVTDIRKSLLSLGIPRLVIVVFMFVLFILGGLKQVGVPDLISSSLVRIGRNGIMVLALLPAIKGGIGLNFGLPLGILSGLVSLLITMELNLPGWTGFGLALLLSIASASIIGYLYGNLLNKVKGDEMMVGTYAGFASVSIMCLAWLVLPFKNEKLIWAIGGKGLRPTLSLDGYYPQILDQLGQFTIGSVIFPTGLLLAFLLVCGLVALFFMTQTGVAISAAGMNEKFARAAGINVPRSRVQATMLSTVLGAIGIVVYAQSFGFVQIYNAPLYMAFPVIACLLIGGADVGQATFFHVIFGTIVFQTLLTIALPVTSLFISGDVSETARIIISNGIILYALVGVGGKKK